MGQEQRFFIDDNDYNAFDTETGKQTINNNMEDFSIILAMQDSMGANHFNSTARDKQPIGDFLSFFNRLGNYNVYHLIPNRKKMAAIIIKLSVILANCFGLYLFVYWLFIDFAGIKLFLTSVGVILYGGMKIYEKYLDLKAKKRKDDEQERRHNHTRHTNGKQK